MAINTNSREELDNGKIRFAFMDPAAVLQLVNREEIATLAGEVKARLERVRDNLAS